MFVPVSVEYNRANLNYIATFLRKNKIPYFIFFGTLLGITRDNDIIKNDDDVDIYINIKDRDKLFSVINETEFEIDYTSPQNQTKFFLQIYKKIRENVFSYVELYFYEEIDNYIVDRWNFRGVGNKKSASIYIPKNIIFPIKDITFNGDVVCVPNNEQKVCKYLYGRNWKVPMIKRKEYRTVILYGKPYQLTGFLGNIAYQIEYKIRNLFNFFNS